MSEWSKPLYTCVPTEEPVPEMIQERHDIYKKTILWKLKRKNDKVKVKRSKTSREGLSKSKSHQNFDELNTECDSLGYKEITHRIRDESFDYQFTKDQNFDEFDPKATIPKSNKLNKYVKPNKWWGKRKQNKRFRGGNQMPQLILLSPPKPRWTHSIWCCAE